MHIPNDFSSFVSLGQRDRTLGPISTAYLSNWRGIFESEMARYRHGVLQQQQLVGVAVSGGGRWGEYVGVLAERVVPRGTGRRIWVSRTWC
jgi:hypothetical protein